MKFNLIDDKLFGKLAGEDEAIETLEYVFVQSAEYDVFNDDAKLRIVKARKGMGKSAVLNMSAHNKRQFKENIVIEVKGSDLITRIPFDNSTDDQQNINDWMRRICSRIAVEIGKTIGFANSDDTITLVENAEILGFKEKNMVSALFDRMLKKVSLGPIELGAAKIPSSNEHELIKRLQTKNLQNVWIYIDDIDAKFKNSEVECERLSSFLTCCRYLVNDIKGLFIRTCLRSDVWTAIAQTDESLDKVEEYFINLKWNEYFIGNIIAKRIQRYMEYNGISSLIGGKKVLNYYDINTLMAKVFMSMPWNRGLVRPGFPIYVFSNGRPRWAIQLCKLAADTAHKNRRDIIRFSDIKTNLKEYGRKRVEDIIREHQHQCKDINKILLAFNNESATLETDVLLKLLEKKLNGEIIIIQGVFGDANILDIARFLFKINFITATNGKDFYSYEQEPDLLMHNVDLDKGYKWAIHPCYRDYIKTN